MIPVTPLRGRIPPTSVDASPALSIAPRHTHFDGRHDSAVKGMTRRQAPSLSVPNIQCRLVLVTRASGRRLPRRFSGRIFAVARSLERAGDASTRSVLHRRLRVPRAQADRGSRRRRALRRTRRCTRSASRTRRLPRAARESVDGRAEHRRRTRSDSRRALSPSPSPSPMPTPSPIPSPAPVANDQPIRRPMMSHSRLPSALTVTTAAHASHTSPRAMA